MPQVEFRTRFSSTNAEHERLLERLWVVAFPPSEPFSRVSPLWTTIGFQQVIAPFVQCSDDVFLFLLSVSYLHSRAPEGCLLFVSSGRWGVAMRAHRRSLLLCCFWLRSLLGGPCH